MGSTIEMPVSNHQAGLQMKKIQPVVSLFCRYMSRF
jgi:hypothetical protein